MRVLFVDRSGHCRHLREQLQAAGTITFDVASLDVVERLEPCRVQGVCLVLEQGPHALEPIYELRARAYTGPLVAVGTASATSVLQAGADDLQPREVQGVELLARLESIRRTSGPFLAGAVVLDPVTRRVWLRECELLDVLRSDVDVLACLLRKPGYAVQVTELARAACGDSTADPSVVHLAIERLRTMLKSEVAILEASGHRAYSLRPDAFEVSSHTPWSKLS